MEAKWPSMTLVFEHKVWSAPHSNQLQKYRNMDTFRAYRRVFANRDPGHPWNEKDDLAFMRLIGVWRQDRETSEIRNVRKLKQKTVG